MERIYKVNCAFFISRDNYKMKATLALTKRTTIQ